jgi:hypothetical protein
MNKCFSRYPFYVSSYCLYFHSMWGCSSQIGMTNMWAANSSSVRRRTNTVMPNTL